MVLANPTHVAHKQLTLPPPLPLLVSDAGEGPAWPLNKDEYLAMVTLDVAYQSASWGDFLPVCA
jgi:hypothetical protein